jgi:hypothetical protein
MHRNILRNVILARQLANSLQISGVHNHRQQERRDMNADLKFWRHILVQNQESLFPDFDLGRPETIRG